VYQSHELACLMRHILSLMEKNISGRMCKAHYVGSCYNCDAEKQLKCVLETALFQANVDTPNGLQWKLIHETWLSGYSGAGSNSSA
jgi:hypothetical protein